MRLTSNLMRARSGSTRGRYKKISHKQHQAQKLRQLAACTEKQELKLRARRAKLMTLINKLENEE